MAYKLTDLPQLRDYFRSVFELGLGGLLEDTITMLWIGKVVINIVAFDKVMRKEHPGEDELSLADLIYKYYGDEALALIDELL